MDGVFLFEDVAVGDSKTTQGYDAIVVEQWTVLKVCVQFFFFLSFFVNQSTPRLWGRHSHTDLCFSNTKEATEVERCNVTITPADDTVGLYDALFILVISVLYWGRVGNVSDGEQWNSGLSVPKIQISARLTVKRISIGCQGNVITQVTVASQL